MFKPFTTHMEAVRATESFLFYNPPISDGLRALLQDALNEASPVMRVLNFTEILYANREELDSEGLKLLAALAAWCTHPANSFGGYSEGRGLAIVNCACRLAGYTPPPGYDFGSGQDDPEIKGQFAVPKPVKEEQSTEGKPKRKPKGKPRGKQPTTSN